MEDRMGNEVKVDKGKMESQLMEVIKEVKDIKSSLDKVKELSEGLFLTKSLAFYDINKMSDSWSRKFESDIAELENLCKQCKE